MGKTWEKNMLAAIRIAGWQKLSLIDYPGKMAAVIFLAGCNMRCHYCHNRQIWDVNQNQIPFNLILDELKQRIDWLDAVVISGGEPTMSPFLIPILRVLRELGLFIKLDTNGTRPDLICQIVKMKLVDYVALDIKAPVDKHVTITGFPINNVLITAQFLKTQNQVKYMFRTTLTPRLTLNDLIEMGEKIICGATCWQIQQCRIPGAYSVSEIQKMVDQLKRYALYVVVKGI